MEGVYDDRSSLDRACAGGWRRMKSVGYGYSVKMASLLPENGVIYESAQVAPSPSKDYCQVLVTADEVIYRSWKISLRSDSKHVTPSETKDSYEDFLYNDRIQHDIRRVFGKNTLHYVTNLAKKQIDFFPRLPNSLLIQVIKFLDLEDISRLSQVSKLFRQVCASEELWQQIYVIQSGSSVTPQLQVLAREKGWKKLFFMNKLQMQLQLRRTQQKKSNERGQSRKNIEETRTAAETK